MPGGALPVDPVHAVAWRVGPHGRRQGRRLQRPLGRRVAPLEARRRQAPHRQILEARIDHHADALPDGRGRLEEPERIGCPDVERLYPEMAAPRQRRADQP